MPHHPGGAGAAIHGRARAAGIAPRYKTGGTGPQLDTYR